MFCCCNTLTSENIGKCIRIIHTITRASYSVCIEVQKDHKNLARLKREGVEAEIHTHILVSKDNIILLNTYMQNALVV